MSSDLDPEANEWRLYFCMVGELWQAVRDRQPEFIMSDLLEEIEGLAFNTNQDVLYRQCQRLLNIVRSSVYRGAGS